MWSINKRNGRNIFSVMHVASFIESLDYRPQQSITTIKYMNDLRRNQSFNALISLNCAFEF
jgi:hypothetical protein